MTEDSNRIIGDFLEINADIISKKAKSNLPEFINNFIYNRYKKRLKKSVYKLQNSNLLLDKSNLSEFFIYCYNNFPPNGSYKSVYKVLYNETSGKVQAIIKFESLQAIIDIEPDYDGFNISVKDKNIETGNYNNFSIHCDKLYSKLHLAKETLELINNRLVKDLTEFIMDNISR